MTDRKTSISKSLALATAAFVSMPAAGAAQDGKLCARMGFRAPPDKARVRRVAPLAVRKEAMQVRVSLWSADLRATPARVAVRIEDIETGARVACEERVLKPGQGTHFGAPLKLRELPTTIGARIWVLPDIGDEVLTLKKRDVVRPRLLGTLVLEDETGKQTLEFK